MKIIENFDLVQFNAYKIHAVCKRAFFPETITDVKAAFVDSGNKKIIIGNGNNLLLSSEYYQDDFIIFNGNFNSIEVKGNVITAQSGATLKEISEIAYKNELKGMEVFWDIPSSIGGAVVMNAGASGEEIKDVLVRVRYLDLVDFQIKEMLNDEIGFVYRNSFFQKDDSKIVLEAEIRLVRGDKVIIKEKMDEIKHNRWKKQPREYPNCGSVFKRPEGRFVGPMLDELGLKGLTYGGAQVSEKHSGFIINKNNATGSDILNLIIEVQKRVKAKFGVDLEVEQRII